MGCPEPNGNEVLLLRSSAITGAPAQSKRDWSVQGLLVHLNRTRRVDDADLGWVLIESVGALKNGAPSLCPPVVAEPALAGR